jgi:6-phospho-beta-glucosidase
MRKVTIIGGGGVRAPLLIYGLAQAQARLGVTEVALFDIDLARTETIARIGREIVKQLGGGFGISVVPRLEDAAAGAEFIFSTVRVGGMAARARDERIAIEHGLAGQETTGPAGAAMALRTLPVTLAHARIVERVSPAAWFINFTNPAGLITQALMQNTSLKVIGICDTPRDLFHKIAQAAGGSLAEMTFDYAGLNHLGWVRSVLLRGEDITDRLLDDSELLRGLYPAELFDPVLIQTLRLIPSEYLFFYYSQRKAYRNQVRAGASRGEELEKLNADLFRQLGVENAPQALATYRAYLMRRNASYMRIEGQAGSAFHTANDDSDPFDTATGYHRIALDVVLGLVSGDEREVVLNVRNCGAIEDLEPDDIVEVTCKVDRDGAHPRSTGRLPGSVRGLVESVKAYERTAIQAALQGSRLFAQLALMEYPIVGQWELAGELLESLIASDPGGLGVLK